MNMRSRLTVIGLTALTLAGCAGARTAGEEREPFVIERSPARAAVGMALADVDSTVQSVQLYRIGVAEPTEPGASYEVQFPTIALGSADRLELKFDLLEPAGRPLSVFFYHADAAWERDLTPSEYLAGFHRDQLINFTPSRATDVPYTHYVYRFPSDAVSFLLSGNYILRVTEQGMEDEVLFERPFYVTEQAVALELGVENMIMSDRGFSAVQPSAAFLPSPALQPGAYDFQVCFVRNGRFEAPRCSEQPRLYQSPALQFYLEPDQAFEPITSDYFLDLSALRVGNQLARVAFDEAPFRVTLEPDYARFPGNPLAPFLRGQTVIAGAVTDVANPDVSAQYVNVGFRFVTDSGRPIDGGVSLSGSFNGWDDRLATRMTWNEAEGHYEADRLLKQGQYEYRYIAGDNRLPRGTVPRPENLYTALVYFSDIHLQTDRLLAIGGVVF
ncbi:MAG: DUF5103 domain-containing protein [Rhodothermales bacterium]|nr:DUF5103 domain-containing protein [Rhodothermales bacterium]